VTGRYAVLLTPPARRALAELLPPSVAAAAWKLITGALADDPWRVGKPLHGPYNVLDLVQHLWP
jgi:mRNA interferase RelE/StbE